jgi:predicted PurR-regulated permease PerM
VYLAQAGAMTKAMVKGQFVIAIAQGFASAFSLWVTGLDYFWFFFVLLTFLSFIPLGGGIVTLPLGVVLIATGHIWQGIFVILFHLLVVSNIDNLLRPRLVPKTVQLNSALTLLGVFSGLALFGAIGVIYGPVIMILLVTTFRMYADYNRRVAKPVPVNS